MKEIVIDLLGGDETFINIIDGVILALKNNIDYKLILIGPYLETSKILEENNISQDKYALIDCSNKVDDETNPFDLLHSKKDTSLGIGYLYLKEHQDAIGMITCSSTGCVIVGSIIYIGLIKNLKMPVLSAIIYDEEDHPFLLSDCGANIDCKEENLVMFASISNLFYQAYYHQNSPRIGLLSNGKNEKKGNDVIKKTHLLLKDQALNFVGNIEMSDIFKNNKDVLICDGILGNTILKGTDEVAQIIKNIINKHLSQKIDKSLYDDLIDDIDIKFDYTNKAGAILLGCKKIIIKCHGTSSKETFYETIFQMIKLDQSQFIDCLEKEM
jgi:glycerol-3-phosphate acyltransferase PlsX